MANDPNKEVEEDDTVLPDFWDRVKKLIESIKMPQEDSTIQDPESII